MGGFCVKLNTYKIKRELKRPLDQLRSLVLLPFETYQKHIHDRDFHKKVHLTAGNDLLGKKVAIFLIYQPKKLVASTLLTCEHLKQNGYSVMLVANHNLKPEDKALLEPVTWQIVERPNLGYDFGGYRDGIRIIQERGLKLDALVVMNDSIWWPIAKNDSALTEIEQAGKDVMGMIMRPSGKPRKRSRHRAPHLQSYFFWFGASVLRNEAFLSFWSDYRLSSFKYNAIRRGELRLTDVLQKAGMTVDALFKFEDLMEKLRPQSTDYLVKVLQYATYKDEELKATSDQLLQREDKNAVWRDEVFDLFELMSKRSEFHMALHFACVDLLGLNFLKRSSGEPRSSPHHVARQHFLDAATNGDIPAPVPSVLAEVVARHGSGAQAVGR